MGMTCRYLRGKMPRDDVNWISTHRSGMWLVESNVESNEAA